MVPNPVKTLPFNCVQAFAVDRHEGLSFSFLKENGELLAIANSSGLTMPEDALALYEELYEKIDKLCYLYPPFYRFFMAIALDLEDLGMPGQKGATLLDYVVKQNFYEADTSDTRRMEIINLLARRNRVPSFDMDSREALLTRVTGFLEQPEQFVKFNRPLFYDLTHLIFYITDYGRQRIVHSDKIFQSLNHIGMLAYLDNDLDLLCEICICYGFLGSAAPALWQNVCASGLRNIEIKHIDEEEARLAQPVDDYHIYLVNSWLMGLSGKEIFQEDFSHNGTVIFTHQKAKKSTLSKIFQVLHPIIMEDMPKRPMKAFEFLSVEDNIQLQTALASSPNSDNFFNKLTNGHISIV